MNKEFFEAFGTEPTIWYTVTDLYYTNNAKTYPASKEDLIKEFPSRRYKVINVTKNYPPITPEIVLKLEEIAMSVIWLYGGDRLIYTYANGVHKYFAENYSDKVCTKGDSKCEALLKLFLHAYAIPKEVIQNEVKELFK